MLPVAGPPVSDGAVLIGGDGRIVAVGPDADVPSPDEVPSHSLPDTVLLPGLINTHTHLELTGFADLAPDDDFPGWIRRLRHLKEERSREVYDAAAARGLQNCFAAGVTTIADTGDSGAVIRAIASVGGSGICYHEVFGPHPDQCGASLEHLQERLGELRAAAGGRARLGVSPHAPYTVSGPLYRASVAWARSQGLPIAIHLAESAAEANLVGKGTGPFAEAWETRGIPLPGNPLHGAGAWGRRTPTSWVDAFGVLGPDTLCIHGIRVDDQDLALVAARGAALAHCPLSNRRHGHGDAPLARYRAAGVRTGVGTDSVASVGVLDLFAEARAAAGLGGLDPGETLRLLTLDGARALGLDDEVGALVPGRYGDVIAVVGRAGTAAEAVRVAVSAEPASVVATVLGGRLVAGRLP